MYFSVGTHFVSIGTQNMKYVVQKYAMWNTPHELCHYTGTFPSSFTSTSSILCSH